jgi:hypothetical protein
VVDQIVSGFSSEFINGFNDQDDLWNWIKTNVVDTFADPNIGQTISESISSAFDLQSKFKADGVGLQQYQSEILSFVDIIKNSGLSEEVQKQILQMFDIGFDDAESIGKGIDTILNHVQSILDEDAKEKVLKLSYSDLQIVDKLDIPSDTLLTWEELQQKIRDVKRALESIATSVKTYSVLAESAESYNDVLNQTAEIVSDNTEVTQEYKDAVKALGISEAELSECFDEDNDLIVKNAKALNKLVKSASKNVATNVKLAKSQARLEYYDLVKQINNTMRSTNVLDAATRNSIKSTFEQIDAVEKALYQYQLLEDTLLGVNNAFDDFAKAKDIDSMNTYGDSYVEMAQTMYDALYKTGQVGTEAFWSSVESLVPTEVYQHLTDDADRMKAIYDYYNKSILPSLRLDEDELSLDYAAIEEFVKKGLREDVGVFTGDIENFDLVEGMNLETAAKLMGMTKTQAYALFAELDKYNAAGSEHSFLSQLDDSIEGKITKVTNSLEDLNKQKLELLSSGGYKQNQQAIDEINAKIIIISKLKKNILVNPNLILFSV